MRDHSKHIELSREDAVECILAASGFMAAGRVVEAEPVPVAESFGRVLARDVLAKNDVPNRTTCMMDSIAVHWSDFEGLGEGELPDTLSWERGRDWEFANTGVAMPDGFDTAIVIEHVQVSEDARHVSIDAAPSSRGAGTRPAGGMLKAGDVVAACGQVVTPDVAAAIAGGNNTVAPCAKKPRVAFIPTGNELVPPGVVPQPDANGRFAASGKNYETNSLLVRGKVQQWGGVYVPFDIVPDEPELIRAAIEQACASADIVVLNAGSSKGSDDWSCEVMEQMGEMICHETTHGPGHHSSFAVIEGVPVVGISGPSGGASFTLDFYLRPLMRAFLGLDPTAQRVRAVLSAEFPAPPHGPGAARPAGGSTPAPSGDAAPAAPAAAAGAGKGEDRPRMERPAGKPFYGVKPIDVHVDEHGTLVATPVAGRPGSREAAAANALAMVANGAGIEPPRAGDVIWVEYR